MKKASLRVRRHVRHLNTYAGHEARPFVKIREVSPRDGLQNEPTSLDATTKARYIRDLARAGMYFIEAGSFVSPKVKQMANTREVLLSPEIADLLSSNYNERPVSLSVLIPNMRGYQDFRDTLQELGSRGLDASRLEIAIFVSATEAFSKANLNASRAEALDRLARVVEEASKHATKVRGYVSCVVKCPYEGFVEPREVASTAKALSAMGCYEISLGDTIGAGDPTSLEDMLHAVTGELPISQLALHCHDTNGRACESVLHLVKLGVRAVDSSLAGLGGCPFAPGAKGNVATEDVVKVLEENFHDTGLVQASSGLSRQEALQTKLQLLYVLGGEISRTLGRQDNARVADNLRR